MQTYGPAPDISGSEILQLLKHQSRCSNMRDFILVTLRTPSVLHLLTLTLMFTVRKRRYHPACGPAIKPVFYRSEHVTTGTFKVRYCVVVFLFPTELYDFIWTFF